MAEPSLAALRDQRRELLTAESGLSFLRRMVQGRLDILRAELDRRVDPAAAADSLVSVRRLAQTLAVDRPVGTAHGIPSAAPVEVADVDVDLARRFEAVAPPTRAAAPWVLGTEDLGRVVAALSELEAAVSARRRGRLAEIDAVQSEVVGRYRRGHASIDALLA